MSPTNQKKASLVLEPRRIRRKESVCGTERIMQLMHKTYFLLLLKSHQMEVLIWSPNCGLCMCLSLMHVMINKNLKPTISPFFLFFLPGTILVGVISKLMKCKHCMRKSEFCCEIFARLYKSCGLPDKLDIKL